MFDISEELKYIRISEVKCAIFSFNLVQNDYFYRKTQNIYKGE
jgi:hypothetical protein